MTAGMKKVNPTWVVQVVEVEPHRETRLTAPMQRIRLISLVTLALLAAIGVSGDAKAQAATIGRLDDTAIRTLVIGKTLLGHYADGERWRETYFVDEGVDYQDLLGRFSGTWSVADGQLCTLYDDPLLNGGCFLVWRRSDNCVDFYIVSPQTGLPSATEAEMRDGLNWTAQGWRSDRPSSCVESAVS